MYRYRIRDMDTGTLEEFARMGVRPRPADMDDPYGDRAAPDDSDEEPPMNSRPYRSIEPPAVALMRIVRQEPCPFVRAPRPTCSCSFEPVFCNFTSASSRRTGTERGLL
jgi:hypothetical protein